VTPIVEHQRPSIEALCRRYRVRRLALFGSAAVGEERPERSDLDFAVEFLPLPPGSYADAYFGLLEALEALYDVIRVDAFEAEGLKALSRCAKGKRKVVERPPREEE